jgi:basic membrane protein A
MRQRLFTAFFILLALALAMGPGPAAAKVNGKFAIALMLPGSLNDGSWNAVAYKAGRQLEATLGIKVTVQEQVKDSDAERVMRGYAAQGYDLIIGHTFNWLDQLYKVSK